MMTGSLMHVPADFLGNFQDALSVPGASFTDATYDLILVFVYMGTATLLAAYIAQSTLIMTGESQARRVSYISFTSLSIGICLSMSSLDSRALCAFYPPTRYGLV